MAQRRHERRHPATDLFGWSSIYGNFLTPLGNDLIFWGSDYWEGGDTPHTGGLSISDGTNAGTHALGVYALPTNYYDLIDPTPRAILNSVLYFPAQTYDGLGNFSDVALWRTDGTRRRNVSRSAPAIRANPEPRHERGRQGVLRHEGRQGHRAAGPTPLTQCQARSERR